MDNDTEDYNKAVEDWRKKADCANAIDDIPPFPWPKPLSEDAGSTQAWREAASGFTETPAPKPLLIIPLPISVNALNRIIEAATANWPDCIIGPEKDGCMVILDGKEGTV